MARAPRNMALIAPDAEVKTISVDFASRPAWLYRICQKRFGPVPGNMGKGPRREAASSPILPGAVTYLKKRWASGCDIIIVPMPLQFDGMGVIEVRKGRI